MVTETVFAGTAVNRVEVLQGLVRMEFKSVGTGHEWCNFCTHAGLLHPYLLKNS